MSTLITILIIIVCLLMALVILIQNPKGGGLATGFSGVNQFGGVKRTTDFLEKSTWTLVSVLFILSILSSSISHTSSNVESTSGELEEMFEGSGGAPQQQLPTNSEDEIILE